MGRFLPYLIDQLPINEFESLAGENPGIQHLIDLRSRKTLARERGALLIGGCKIEAAITSLSHDWLKHPLRAPQR
jgi:hypothetical protein